MTKSFNPLKPSAPISGINQAKLDKETLNDKPKTQKQPDKSPCGLDDPCNFGTWNKQFNKNCL